MATGEAMTPLGAARAPMKEEPMMSNVPEAQQLLLTENINDCRSYLTTSCKNLLERIAHTTRCAEKLLANPESKSTMQLIQASDLVLVWLLEAVADELRELQLERHRLIEALSRASEAHLDKVHPLHRGPAAAAT
jgi:hypothetical protein